MADEKKITVAADAVAADAAAAEAAAAEAAAEAAAAAKPAAAHKLGDKVLVSASIADQVNVLTHQRIPHGSPVIAFYDAWIGIQLDAGVLVETAL